MTARTMVERETVGQRIRRLRERAGVTQEVVARDAGIGRSWLSRVESGGIVEVGAEPLERLARYFRCSTHYLLTGSEAESDMERAGEKADLLALQRIVQEANVIMRRLLTHPTRPPQSRRRRPEKDADREAGRDDPDANRERPVND